MARWAMLGTQLPPGGESPPLSFAAVGLPGTLRSWADGYFPVPEYHPIVNPPNQTAPIRFSNSVLITTVGIEPFPSDVTPAGLLGRLTEALSSTCDLGWIDDSGACSDLDSVLQAALVAVSEGNNSLARDALGTFLATLEGRPVPGPIGDSAYWLLKINAEYILGLIPAPVTVTLTPASDSYVRLGDKKRLR